MNELTVDKRFLTTILNELRLADHTAVPIHSSVWGRRMLDMDINSWTLHSVIADDAVSAAVNRLLRNSPQDVAKDFPSYADLRECLWSSLVLPPVNMDEFVTLINRTVKESARGSGFSSQSVISLDSNLSYRRVLSRAFLERERFGINNSRPKDLMVVMSNVSKAEITDVANHKFDRQGDVEALSRCYDDRWLKGSLFNTGPLRTRKALNAYSELAIVRDRFTSFEATGGDAFIRDKEARDQEILKELSRFKSDNQVDMTFVTADDKAMTLVEVARIHGLMLRYPNDIPRRVESTPWLVRELLFDLAIVMRKIDLRGTGVSIAGDWTGKSVDDWRNERVKVLIEDGSKVGGELIRDHRIIKRMDESDIIDPDRIR